VSKRKTTKGAAKAKPQTKAIIASRKSCRATGTGLSHYILTDRKAK
jgi:modified peptide precursor CbpA